MSNWSPLRFIKSGEKYTTQQGFRAIKDGMKKKTLCGTASQSSQLLPKPDWLQVSVKPDPKFNAIKNLVHSHQLSTVCEEAKCPNIHECWTAGTATLMVMGSVCTRACRFCAVDTGNPQGWLDLDEPEHCAKTVATMQLQYVVITSVDRDDLPDGGAEHYAKCVRAVKKASPHTKIEVLAPDFQGNQEAIQILLDAGIDVFAQNIETVKRLTHQVRDPRASYEQTLEVLAFAKAYQPQLLTKTSLMLGLGESDEEIHHTLEDIYQHHVDIVTMGQYLQPTAHHLPVQRYVSPQDFQMYRSWGLTKGFLEVVSGPLVRSSYRAEKVFQQNNVGL